MESSPTSLETLTPQEIDTQLADLYQQEQRDRQALIAALNYVHRALGERPLRIGRSRSTWPTTDTAALDDIRAKAAAGERLDLSHSFRSFADVVASYDAALAALTAVRRAQEPLDAEYARRPWSRFFLVQNNGGHIHRDLSSYRCSRQPTTVHGWNPALSGLTEAQAVAQLGPRLCTVCFPSAPVEWSVGVQREHCAGGRPAPDTIQRFRTRAYGECPTCHVQHPMTSAGVVRKHPPKTA